jgi:hypothetical protein
MSGNLYWGEILDKFMENYNHAFVNRAIQKPKSWALYKTWELVNSIEKPRRWDLKNE